MSNLHNAAMDILNELNASGKLEYQHYSTIFAALDEIETLRDRDMALEELWSRLEDVPMDPDTEKLEEPFLGWEPGTDREDIWHWFDVRHSKGIGYLLYRDGIDRTDLYSKMVYLKNIGCIDCESSSCQFNHMGECRFALVHERKPRINDYDGCIDYDYCEAGGLRDDG